MGEAQESYGPAEGNFSAGEFFVQIYVTLSIRSARGSASRALFFSGYYWQIKKCLLNFYGKVRNCGT